MFKKLKQRFLPNYEPASFVLDFMIFLNGLAMLLLFSWLWITPQGTAIFG